MRKYCTIFFAFLLLSAGLADFTSCEKYVLPELTLSVDTLFCTEFQQTLPVGVHSNVKWQMTYDKSNAWLSATPTREVRGDSTIFVTVEANTEEEPREATLTVTSETLRRFLVVRQEGAFL